MPSITQIIGDVPPMGAARTPLAQIGLVDNIFGASMRHQSSTGFLWGTTTAGAGPGDYAITSGSVVFEGTGLVYDGGDLPVSGTITSIIVTNGGTVSGNTTINGVKRLEYSGLSMDVADLRDELRQALNGNTAALKTYFDGLAWSYEGGDHITPGDWYLGGNLADTITGNDGYDYLRGGGGDDVIHGGHKGGAIFGDDGNDMLFGGAGQDTLQGGDGADLLNGGANLDFVSYYEATSGVTVNLVDPAINTGAAAGDTFISIENLSGSKFNDVLTGNSDTIWLIGYSGDDVFSAPGAGPVVFGGWDGIDRVDYSGGPALTAALNNSKHNKGQATGDIYDYIEDLTGSGFHDSLYGDNRANTLNGGAGNDILKAYKGNDTLIGGTGRDIFIFNSTLDGAYNIDTIVDFSAPHDTIHLDNSVFTRLTTTGPLVPSAFKDIANGTKDANDRIIYDSDTGNLYYDRDGSGTAFGNTWFAVLTGAPTITAADFMVI